jgi:hypothetical protein
MIFTDTIFLPKLIQTKMNYVYEHGHIAMAHMGELKTPKLPMAPTKIKQLQATKVAGLVEHTGEDVPGQTPEISTTAVYECPMPKLPDGLMKISHPSATRPCFGNIKMEMRDDKGISLVYIG